MRRFENLEEDKKVVLEDIKELLAEAKSSGLDPKIIRKVVRLRSKDRRELEEEKAVLDAYYIEAGLGFLV